MMRMRSKIAPFRLVLVLVLVLVGSVAPLTSGTQARQADPEPGTEIWLGDELAVSYRARIERGWLIVEAEHEPGWHTYAMDNVVRAREKTGKARPETELPTVITPLGGLTVEGEWRQSEPLDLSTPDIRWFTWGFEGRSFFAARVENGSSGASVQVDAQACTKDRCAMVDALRVPIAPHRAEDEASVDPDSLVIVAPGSEE